MRGHTRAGTEASGLLETAFGLLFLMRSSEVYHPTTPRGVGRKPAVPTTPRAGTK